MGLLATFDHLPYKLSLHFLANPHAAIAVDALRHIDSNVRMRFVEKLEVLFAQKVGTRQAVLTRKFMKWLVGKILEGCPWIFASEHAQIHSSGMLELGRVGLDDHAVLQLVHA